MKQLPERFSVYAATLEEAEYITQKQKELCGGSNSIKNKEHFYRFDLKEKDYGYAEKSYITDSDLKSYNIKHEFTCDEFKAFFEEEFVLPEKWKLKITDENKDVINNWRKKICIYENDCKFLYITENGVGDSYSYKAPEITFEQFKKYVLKQNDMNKEIEKYIVKIDKLVGINGISWYKGDFIYASNCQSLPYFKSLGLTENPNILEPVYKTEEKVISMGSFNLTVKPEGIFYNNIENISNFVMNLVTYFPKPNSENTYGAYKVTIEDITFSVTGCQKTTTKLSQWLAVWEEYLKIKQ